MAGSKIQNHFVTHVLEQFQGLGPLKARAMFGGWGIYCGDQIFAIIADDVLFLKADAESKAVFEKVGSRPFVYTANGRTATMSYFTAPEGVFDDEAAALKWGETALAATRRASARKKRR